jgi:hypothetical protein
MTFDEIQKTIEQMLAVQRELQESQLRFQESQQEQRQGIQSLRQEIEALVAIQRDVLAVQRDLQENQITQRQDIQERHQDYLAEIQALIIAQHEQRVLLDRLIGYSLTNESDHLDLHERMDRLEERMRRIRGNGNG